MRIPDAVHQDPFPVLNGRGVHDHVGALENSLDLHFALEHRRVLIIRENIPHRAREHRIRQFFSFLQVLFQVVAFPVFTDWNGMNTMTMKETEQKD